MAGIFLFFESDLFSLYYDCANFDANYVPLEHRQRPWLGTMCIVLFVIFECTNIPSMCVMWRHLEMSCYKIMFVIGLADLFALVMVALIPGVLSIRGEVYCSHPTLSYFVGMFATFFWSVESCSACLLALDRCLELGFPNTANLMFGGARTWLYFAPILAYSAYYGFFTMANLWNPICFCWVQDPHAFYPKAFYEESFIRQLDILDIAHSATVAVFIPCVYLFLIVLLKAKFGDVAQHSADAQSTLRVVFLQTFLVCLVNTTNGVSQVIANINELIGVPFSMIPLFEFTWIIIHGLPSVIYLTVNRTIRSECAEMFRHWAHVLRRWLIGGPSSNSVGVQGAHGARGAQQNIRNLKNERGLII